MGLKLEKMKIIPANTWEKLHSPFALLGAWEVTFNPNSYKEQYTNSYHCSQVINSFGGPTRYKSSKPVSLSITLVFDATGTNNFGVIQVGKELFGSNDIAKQIQKFKKATTIPAGSTHEPKWLRLLWGDLDFTGRLTSANIHYKLFSNSGKPLRANLDVTFMGAHSDKGWKKISNLQSPDVTHQMVVKDGETLPMLCKQVYGHERYFRQVAQANQLNNFRDLTPGMVLHFPPLKSEEAEA